MKILKVLRLTSYLLIAMIFYGCKGEAKESVMDGDFKIDFLFEKDGCKIYRFRDGGRFIYWSNCQGNMQNEEHHSNGKTSHPEFMESFTNVK